MENYSRVFLPITVIPVKYKGDDNETGYNWDDNIEMKDIREANMGHNVREDSEVAVKEHVDAKPDLSRIPDYQ